MKIRVLGTTLMVSTEVSLEQLKELSIRKPDALKLVEESEGKKTELFCVNVGQTAQLTRFGATFTGVTNNEPKVAMLTIDLGGKPEDVNVKDYVADKYGAAILNLQKVEAQFKPALDDAASERAMLAGLIDVAL